eukprot:g45419.t1
MSTILIFTFDFRQSFTGSTLEILANFSELSNVSRLCSMCPVLARMARAHRLRHSGRKSLQFSISSFFINSRPTPSISSGGQPQFSSVQPRA